MRKIGLLALTAGAMAAVVFAPHACAQSVNAKAKEKVRWFNAPREIQIIDDRPIVKDFREAPSAPQQIQLPPGPQGMPGFSGGGAGAMGGEDGGTLPSGGMPLGNGGPGYRTDSPMSPVPLPKADFGHQASNIPARGMGPKGPLPGGYNTGIHGKVMPFAKAAPGSGMGAARGMSNSRASGSMAPSTASYGGGYGVATGGGSGYGSGGSSTAVHASLLRKMK